MKITKYLIGGLAALALVGCKDKMRELNSDPAIVGDADPRYMFLNAMNNLDVRGSTSLAGRVTSEGQIMQYFVYYDGAQDGTYCKNGSYSVPSQIGQYYNWLYDIGYKMVALQQWIDAMEEVEALKYQDLRAMAGVVRVYEAFRVFQNYGAAVYSQAFKAISDGIMTPTYDIFSNEVYESLDDELAGYIKVLEAPANAGTPELGAYDPLYGYTVNPVVGKPKVRTNYTQQRTLWFKFANSYRLYMAWIMKAADPARFNDVLAQTNGKYFSSADDGAYVYYNGYSQNEDVYNSDNVAQVSLFYSVSDNFISYLKELDDPRLPLLARANGLYAENKGIQWIQHYFPDSLVSQTRGGVTSSWDGIFDFEADPMLAYQGQSPNPYNYQTTNANHPGEFWGQRTVSFRFYHPDYKPNDAEANKKLKKPWLVDNQGDVTKDFPIKDTIWNADTTISIAIACRPQGRYFCAVGGKTFEDPGSLNNGNGYDGPIDNRNEYSYRFPLYTYPEFCFMMAYLTLDGVATGQSADIWYETALTEAMKELQADAIRYGIQVATSESHTGTTKTGVTVSTNPAIVGINDQKPYDMTDKIAPYVTAQALANAADKKEAIVGQMWIYCYNQPIKMWDWWRITGYPRIVEVAAPADRPGGLYWVKPSTRTAGNPLEFPRRGALPQPNILNNDNYNAARETLRATFPEYGAYDATTGRIFWDQQGL